MALSRETMGRIDDIMNTRRVLGSVFPKELATIGVGSAIASIVEHDRSIDPKTEIDAETVRAQVAVAIATQRNLRGTNIGNMLKSLDIKDKNGKVIALITIEAGQNGSFNVHEILE